MDPVQRLYAVALEDFVAERKRVARELRAAGDRDAAAELARLPKPTPPAWALNALARERPDVVGAWVDVAQALRAASAKPGPRLRDAMAAHREATQQLVALVREEIRPGGKPLSEPMVERVRALLQDATVDGERAERLRAGLVVEDDDPPPLLLGGIEAPPAAEADAADAADEDDDTAEREAAERRRAELEERAREAAERAAQRREEAAERAHAAAEAAERLEDARRALVRSESEAEAAEQAAAEAREAAAEAEREADLVATRLRDAAG